MYLVDVKFFDWEIANDLIRFSSLEDVNKYIKNLHDKCRNGFEVEIFKIRKL